MLTINDPQPGDLEALTVGRTIIAATSESLTLDDGTVIAIHVGYRYSAQWMGAVALLNRKGGSITRCEKTATRNIGGRLVFALRFLSGDETVAEIDNYSVGLYGDDLTPDEGDYIAPITLVAFIGVKVSVSPRAIKWAADYR